MKKTYDEMDDVSKTVADFLDKQLYDYKKYCKNGKMSEDMLNCMARTVIYTLDSWTPELTVALRLEILDWFQDEYKLCI